MKRGRNVGSSVTALVERIERIERIHGCRKSDASRRRLCGTLRGIVRDTAHRLYTSRTRYALFYTRDERDVFQSERTERGKKEEMTLSSAAPGDEFGYDVPQIALLRDTLWHFYGPSPREEPFVLRVPTLCVDSGCKLREPVAAFSFLRSRRAEI